MQGDHKISVHLIITIQKVTVMFNVSPASLQILLKRRTVFSKTVFGIALTPSVIRNSNYVIMVSDWNCLKCFLYCNHQVHRDFLITQYFDVRHTVAAMEEQRQAVCQNYVFNTLLYIFSHGATASSMPRSPHCRRLINTVKHTTFSRTPLDEWSALRRNLYLTTHNTHNGQTSMPPVGFKPTGHRNRLSLCYITYYYTTVKMPPNHW
jgi:hypothetical protein